MITIYKKNDELLGQTGTFVRFFLSGEITVDVTQARVEYIEPEYVLRVPLTMLMLKQIQWDEYLSEYPEQVRLNARTELLAALDVNEDQLPATYIILGTDLSWGN